MATKTTSKKLSRTRTPSKKLSIAKRTEASLSLANPGDVMAFGKTLKNFIKDNNLSVKIGNTDYSMVDGWKYAGLNFGLTAIPTKPVARHKEGEYITVVYAMREFSGKNGKYKKEMAVFAGFTRHQEIIDQIKLREKNNSPREATKPYFAYECDCEIVKLSDGTRVSRGTGFCSNLELLKSGFDEYSVISMSETRSIGKGYRNLIGFVMKAAGIEATPAEEMEKEMVQPKEDQWRMPDLPYPTDEQFTKIIEKIGSFEKIEAADSLIKEYEEKHFSFTPAHREAIDMERRTFGVRQS